MYRSLCLFILTFSMSVASLLAQETHWMPDANLRQAVRESLHLSEAQPLTQQMMRRLTELNAADQTIRDLKGLELATNATWLTLGGNLISDLRPLRELTQLDGLDLWSNPISDLTPVSRLTSLRHLNVAGCEISDIRPLRALRNLQILLLNYNRISDIAPLATLTDLRDLYLSYNQIVDVRPLQGLKKLKRLEIENNPIRDFSPLDGLELTHFSKDEVCLLDRLDIHQRLENREYPSVFNAWYDILNRPELSYEERLAYHDLDWNVYKFGLDMRASKDGFHVIGNLENAKRERDALLAMNPNMISILSMAFVDESLDNFPEDWQYWLRDHDGNLVIPAESENSVLMDFTHPAVQDLIVERALAAARCGLYDGIFFDYWSDDYQLLRDPHTGKPYRTLFAELHARESILQRIRAGVDDDFLIIVNSNRNKTPISAPYINGLFMETLRDHEGGYTRQGLMQIESTLLWAEENLRTPQVNCLEGWGIRSQPPDSSNEPTPGCGCSQP